MFFSRLVPILCLVVLAASPAAAERKPVTPTENDKCPVCGMFVAKYPDMLAEIIFRDGTYAVFDGPKDMFRYYLNMKKYNHLKNINDIDSIYVHEYYNLTFIDGRKAYYVAGSDVNGPMGRELIPFLKEEDASAFRKDHKGKILRFGDITEAVLKTLE
ncbi:MAG: nitrous oxide reductase accessory protein NosL [Dissulfurispiraceae bacterium]|jgi:nitrous oxide reductase accessory protein NosL